MTSARKILWKKTKTDTIQCLVCQRKCLLSDGQTGFCQARRNQKNQIISLTYGLLSGPPSADPVEKKPLYHFLPGTKTLSLGTFGCNFRCRKCLNWWCSWGEPAGEILTALAQADQPFPRAYRLTPKQVVERCLRAGLPSLSFTYNEPVIGAEFVHDTAKLARQKGLKTILVTNGSWTKNTLDYLGPYLDAANVDFKSFSETTAKKIGSFFKKIPEMTRYSQKYKIHLELTTVLIPGINDSTKEQKLMTSWIVKNLGPETPWHVSAFSPRLAPVPEFQKIPPPSQAQLKKAAKIGLKTGLKYVYVWGPGIYTQGDTVCPACGKKVIFRTDWEPKTSGLTPQGKCRACGKKLNFVLK